MANGWDVFSKVHQSIEDREAVGSVGAVNQTAAAPTYHELISICTKLYTQALNLETDNHFLYAEIRRLSKRNAELSEALELAGEGDAGDDGDYYVAGSPVISRRTH